MNELTTTGKTAFIFPGQAAQTPGMGRDLYLNSEAARSVFEEVDETLGRHFSELIFSGDIDELTLTENAQPAIATVSLAAWSAIEEAIGCPHTPHFAAGHSLGEYSALAVAGVMNVAETISLIAERGRLMEEACRIKQGGMAALVGIDKQTVEEVCAQTGVYISNINTQQQIIISGDQTRLAQAIDLASRRGAKRALRLRVGGAFHTELMAPAQNKLEEVIESMEFHDPIIPIIANVTSEPLTTAEEIKTELKTQLQSCIQWSSSIFNMASYGVNTFVEVGPGSTLTSMVKRIVPGVRVMSIGNYEMVERYAESAI